MKNIWHNHDTIVHWHFCIDTHLCGGICVISIFIFLLAASECVWVGAGGQKLILTWPSDWSFQYYIYLLIVCHTVVESGGYASVHTYSRSLSFSSRLFKTSLTLRELMSMIYMWVPQLHILPLQSSFLVHVSPFFVWFPEQCRPETRPRDLHVCWLLGNLQWWVLIGCSSLLQYCLVHCSVKTQKVILLSANLRKAGIFRN